MAEKRGRNGGKKAAAPRAGARAKTSAAKKPVAKKPTAKKTAPRKEPNRLHVAKRLRNLPLKQMTLHHAVEPLLSQMGLNVHWGAGFFGLQCLWASGDS